MELIQQIQEALQKPLNVDEEQARQIRTAVKMVDDLVQKGHIEPPTYRLTIAHLGSTPTNLRK